MSTAEITARKVYQEYNLGKLPNDVKRQLIILFLTNESGVLDDALPLASVDELRHRAENSYQQAKNGEGKPLEELLDNLDSKYPWL